MITPIAATWRAEVAAECGRLLAQLTGVSPGELDEQLELVGDLGMESLQVLEWVCLVEDAFAVQIDVTPGHPVITLGQLVDRVAAAALGAPQVSDEHTSTLSKS